MTPLTQDTAGKRTAGGKPSLPRPPHPAQQQVLRRLRDLVVEQEHPFSWVAAERITARQAATLIRLAKRTGANVAEFIAALPGVRVRLDEDLPRMSAHYWDATTRRWIIVIGATQPPAARRFLILREFKLILDHPKVSLLYDPDHVLGAAQIEMAADHFAASALMPARAVRAALRTRNITLQAIAERLGVPEYRAALRLSDLNLINRITDPRERRRTP